MTPTRFKPGRTIRWPVFSDTFWIQAVHGFEDLSSDDLDGLDPKDKVAIIEWVNTASSRMVRRNRSQIIQTFPVLLPMLARSPLGQDIIALTSAIDDGVPLIDAIASLTGAKKGSVRYLRGKRISLLGYEWIENPFQLLKCLDETPDHRRPMNAQEWKTLWQLWRGSIQISGSLVDINDYELGFHRWRSRYCSGTNLDDPLGEVGKHIFTGLCSCGYTKAEEILQPNQNRDNCWEDLSDFAINVGRWCEHKARDLKFNAHLADICRDRITFELLMQYPAIKLMELSIQWRQIIIRSQALSAEIPHWPPLLPVPIYSHGLTVVSLTDSSQLAEEGRRLKHCVSAYTSACLCGLSHILSIRDQAGECLSTVEISLKNESSGKLMPEVLQHVGEKNREPDPLNKAALAAVMHKLRKPRSQNRFRRINAMLAEREKEIAAYLSGAASDFAIAAISEVLPRVVQVEAWLKQRLIQEEFWYCHRNDLEDECAAKVGLGDLHDLDLIEVLWSDPFRWEQYERLTGHQQFL